MSLAETAVLAVELKLNGVTAYSSGIAKAEAATANLNRTVTGAPGKLSGLANAAGSVEKGVNKFSGALGHAGSQLKGLITGPLGLIGGTTALFSLGGAFAAGIGKAESMALAVEKLTGVTGLSAHSASQLVAVFGKFGIEGDRVVTIAGFAEKAIGKLAETMSKGKDPVSKLTVLDKLYGISLVDSKGHAVDFATELGRVADYYNSSASASAKAALAAQLFGRGYVALIPILKLGSAGIAEAAKEADALGLTLRSAQDVQNVHDFIAAQREAKDALAGLEVQLGLLVMPDLTGALRGFTGYLSTHRAEVQAFFKDALKTAEGFAHFVTGTVVPVVTGLVGAATTAWNALPGGLKDLLIGGAIANKTTKFLFDFSIPDIGKGIFGVAGQQFFARGSPGNPMFVASETGGIGGAGGIAGNLLTAVVLPLAISAAVGDALVNFFHPNAPGASSSQKVANLNYSFSDLMARNAAGGSSANFIGPPAPSYLTKFTPGGGLPPDERGGAAGLAANTRWLSANTDALRANSANLVHLTNYEELKKGVRARSAAKYGGTGLGPDAVSATMGRDIISADHQLVFHSKDMAGTTKRLQADFAYFKSHGDTANARRIQQLEDTLRRKKLAVTTTVNVTVPVNVSPTALSKAQLTTRNYGKTYIGEIAS